MPLQLDTTYMIGELQYGLAILAHLSNGFRSLPNPYSLRNIMDEHESVLAAVLSTITGSRHRAGFIPDQLKNVFTAMTDFLKSDNYKKLERMYNLKSTDEKRELLYVGASLMNNIRSTGYIDWYSWSIANWGTKWDICDSYLMKTPAAPGKIILKLYTAWETPFKVFEKWINEFSLNVQLLSATEDMEYNYMYFENGITVIDTYNDPDLVRVVCPWIECPRLRSYISSPEDAAESSGDIGITEALVPTTLSVLTDDTEYQENISHYQEFVSPLIQYLENFPDVDYTKNYLPPEYYVSPEMLAKQEDSALRENTVKNAKHFIRPYLHNSLNLFTAIGNSIVHFRW